MRILLGAAVVLALAWGTPAVAVIIASGDGTGNTSAPADDPGFAHVVRNAGMTAVYIGDGWLLTANHAHANDVQAGGVTYRAVPGSDVRLLTPGEDPADLLLFRIESDPGLPSLPIAASPPAGDVVMIGMGRNRGDPIYDWDGSGDLDGWYWGLGRAVRWGTNQVKSVSVANTEGGFTWSFTVDFSESGGTADECQVAVGDSGAPVFSKNGAVWELTGIQLTRTVYAGQLSGPFYESALFGNESWSGQLSDYRDQILGIIASLGPACSNGIDDDGDGLLDYPDDPGCLDPDDAFERSADLPCDDGIDNDGDGGVDFDPVTYADPGDESTLPAGEGDPGCGDPTWRTESPKCQDGVHNDNDGKMDYDAGLLANDSADPAGPDPQCVDRPWQNRESSHALYYCGLGAELTLLLPPLIWLRRRWH